MRALSLFIVFAALMLTSTCGRDGVDGLNGMDGKDGRDGVDGKSCTVESLANGLRLYCEDGSEALVFNGRDGRDGVDGSNGRDGVDGLNGSSSVLSIIDPCGDDPSEFDEVLLLTEHGYIAYFEDKGKRFLSLLAPGSYRTTDRQACEFSIDASGNLVYNR
jgi:hypothetical protein